MTNNKLFTPFQLGPITLRNRFIRSAAFENMARANKPTQELIDYHVSVARGGVGMTTVAYCAVDLSGVSFDGQLYVCDDIIPDMRKMTDAIHAEGAKASIQMGHCGNMTHFYTCHCMPVSADTWFNLYSPTIHRRLKVAEINSARRLILPANVDSIVWRFTPDTPTSSPSSLPSVPTAVAMSTEALSRTGCGS